MKFQFGCGALIRWAKKVNEKLTDLTDAWTNTHCSWESTRCSVEKFLRNIQRETLQTVTENLRVFNATQRQQQQQTLEDRSVGSRERVHIFNILRDFLSGCRKA